MAETIGARERGRITPDEGAVLAAETAPQELLGAVLAIYRNTGMLTVYKAPGFRAELRQSLSVVLLQVGLRGA